MTTCRMVSAYGCGSIQVVILARYAQQLNIILMTHLDWLYSTIGRKNGLWGTV